MTIYIIIISLGNGDATGYGGTKCCGSSVVERVLGKDEGQSSILCRSTTRTQFRARTAPPCAVSGSHIRHVLLHRARPQMRRIHTERVVTGVQYMHGFWDRAVERLIGNPMSSQHFPIHLHLAISLGRGAGPKPAHALMPRCGWYFHLCPKARDSDRRVASHDVISQSDPLRLEAAGAATPAVSPSYQGRFSLQTRK